MAIKMAVAVLAGGLLVAACAPMRTIAPGAVADLAPTKGNTARGTVTFRPDGDRFVIVADLSGLAPGGHGFHVHEKGDCSADDGMSAGGHFNPTGKPHGNPGSPDHHAGDMPMLMADASGNAHMEASIKASSVATGVTDLVGKAVIVHKDADDFATQPTGNSGARIACGVIRAQV
ncbi:MAG: superoxide dismutase family protein [Pseudomonadota bacterium]|nr:superoxide dismutase family protein [Pseudomonadota bacterium]